MGDLMFRHWLITEYNSTSLFCGLDASVTLRRRTPYGNPMSGILYLVPTPIGNLEDITLRALRILKEASLIACEDTRTSRILLQHYDITTPLTSYHEHNKLMKLDALFAALELGDVALISDAGTPGISDPGFELVREAAIRGYRVEALPGANAVLPALTASGLPTDTFIFLGFLPRKGLKDLFTMLAHVRRTLIAYESPNRLAETLEAARDAFGGDRPCCVAREISKKFEEFTRGTIDDVLKRYGGEAPRGEIVVLFGPAPAPGIWDEPRVRAAFKSLIDAGESRSAAAKAVAADSGWKRNDIYDLEV